MGSEIYSTLIKPSKFCQSGGILPNLVTLDAIKASLNTINIKPLVLSIAFDLVPEF